MRSTLLSQVTFVIDLIGNTPLVRVRKECEGKMRAVGAQMSKRGILIIIMRKRRKSRTKLRTLSTLTSLKIKPTRRLGGDVSALIEMIWGNAMSNTTAITTSIEGRFERLLGWAAIYRDYFFAKDETTKRIKSALKVTPWAVYPRSTPESESRIYSSLAYPTAEAAQEAFARADHSLVYGRDGTPDGSRLMCALLQIDTAAEAGRVTGHGMAAIEAALLGAKSGEHIVASRHIFGTSKRNLKDLLLEKNISVTFVDGRKPAEWEAAIQPNKTRLFFFEPLGNPGIEVADTQAIATIAHKDDRDILVVADNSMTPLDQSLSKGADIVAFSTTKFLGLGKDNGGAILVTKEGLDRLERLFPNTGRGNPVLIRSARKGLTQSHRGAWAMLANIKVSVLRHQRQIETASLLAQWLVAQNGSLHVASSALNPLVAPHERGQVFSFDLGDQQRAFRIINALAKEGVGVVNNFGSDRTTVIHPGTTTQSSLSAQEQAEQGISPGLVRVSIGVERPAYLQRVFARALAQG